MRLLCFRVLRGSAEAVAMRDWKIKRFGCLLYFLRDISPKKLLKSVHVCQRNSELNVVPFWDTVYFDRVLCMLIVMC